MSKMLLARRMFMAASGGPLLLGGAAVTSPSPPPDAELIRLGALLDAAMAEEDALWAAALADAASEKVAIAANDRTHDIVRQIETVSAVSLAGLLVKARSLCWCKSGEPVTAEDFYDGGGPPATDTRVMISMLNDLSAMGVRT